MNEDEYRLMQINAGECILYNSADTNTNSDTND